MNVGDLGLAVLPGNLRFGLSQVLMLHSPGSDTVLFRSLPLGSIKVRKVVLFCKLLQQVIELSGVWVLQASASFEVSIVHNYVHVGNMVGIVVVDDRILEDQKRPLRPIGSKAPECL